MYNGMQVVGFGSNAGYSSTHGGVAVPPLGRHGTNPYGSLQERAWINHAGFTQNQWMNPSSGVNPAPQEQIGVIPVVSARWSGQSGGAASRQGLYPVLCCLSTRLELYL